MKKVISLDSLRYAKLYLSVSPISDEDFEERTGMKFIMRKQYKNRNLYLFKITNQKVYCYARMKYEF
jgi:hypothetical protein